MEKKKNTRDINTLWTLFSYRQFGSNFLWRNFDPKFSSLGFTLIELLIVIAVIGIMAVGIVTILDPMAQIQKAQDAKRKSDLSQIQKAVETYYNDFGQYPAADTFYRIMADANTPLDWGSTQWQYIGILPKDPSSSRIYVYYSPADGQSYYLYASLERGANDPQACNKGLACTNVPTQASCGVSVFCNYGVSSPNVSP